MAGRLSGGVRRRVVPLLGVVILIALGLGIRRYKEHLPGPVTLVVPDALWTLMVYSLIRALSPKARPLVVFGFALLLSFSVEFLQLYHAPWIDYIRSFKVGGWILGFTFLWLDLACYTAGAAVGLGAELLVRQMRGNNDYD